MPAFRRLAALSIAISVQTPLAASAMDEFISASDAAKCRRRLDNSSTARLFPARASPDIDNSGGSIR
jgi:hypothetical protein